jgi:hypothetical protein
VLYLPSVNMNVYDDEASMGAEAAYAMIGHECAKVTDATLQAILESRKIGNIHTIMTLMEECGNNAVNRISIDIVYPTLIIRDNAVMIHFGPTEMEKFLCPLTDSLISQMIVLKPFMVPENKAFFIAWLQRIHEIVSSSSGLSQLFGASDSLNDVELWFAQKGLPSINVNNPAVGAFETLAAFRQ